jgi:adenylate/nucleoside-diphosphate kinase
VKQLRKQLWSVVECECRPDLIERQQAQPLTEKELPFYEQSYQYKQSKFGRNSPLQLSNPVKERRFAVLYRERIYYLASSEEQKAFLLEPSKFTKSVDALPLDIQTAPKISVLGLPKSGKTTLCQKICAATGAVHLQMADIIQQFIEMDSVQCERLRKEMKKEGRPCED